MIIPIDKYDRENLLSTLEELRRGIEDGKVTGYVVIAINKDGSNIHSHNAEVDDFIKLVGLMELKKRDLLDRYENY